MTFNSLVLRSQNLETTVAWYRTIGLIWTREQHGSGPVHFSSETGGVIIEIYPLAPNQTSVDDSIQLGFAVNALESVLKSLNEATEIKTSEWGRFANVRDPDGRRIRLSE